MKTHRQIEEAIDEVAKNKRDFGGMTYKEGIREALEWVIGEIDDDEFEFSPTSSDGD